jgi:hypothetical protein
MAMVAQYIDVLQGTASLRRGRRRRSQINPSQKSDRNVRFKRTCERRDPSVSRETASAGPSPAQLTELRLLYTLTRSRGFPRRRTGSQNRRFRADFCPLADSRIAVSK